MTNTLSPGREAKYDAEADYIESLSSLKEAEARRVDAQAAFDQANADYRQAQVDYQKILNEIAQCDADARKAQLTKELKFWETELKKQEERFARAEYELQKTLRNIAVMSADLTKTEKDAIKTYLQKYDEYIGAQEQLREAQAWLYYANDNYADYVGDLERKNADAAAYMAKYQEIIDNLPIEAGQEEAAAFFEEYENELAVLKVDSVNLQKEFNLFKVENVNGSIREFTRDLSKWFVQNVALPAPFQMAYKTALPDNEIVVNALYKYMSDNNNSLIDDPSKSPFGKTANGFSFDEEKSEIAANFNAAPTARRMIFGYEKGKDSTDVRSLSNIVDALSRELVIDPAATSVDTAGLAKAVADAWDEYEETEAALEAGADAYAAAALETLKAKKQAKADADTAVAEAVAEYAAQKASLKAAIEKFVEEWNGIAEHCVEDGKMSSNDTTVLWKAFKNLIDVRAAVLPYEGEKEYFYYRKGADNDGVIDTGKVKFTELKKGQILKTNSKIKALDDIKYGGSETSLSDAINQFFGCQYFREHMSIDPDGILTAVDYDGLYDATEYFSTLFFEKYYSHADFTKVLLCGSVPAKEFEPEAVTAAKTAQTKAQTAVDNATEDFVAKHKEFYTDVYGKFWGIKVEKGTQIDSTKEVKVNDTAKVLVWKFASSYTPLVQNFTVETFTENPEIVKFDVYTTSYKKKVFYNASNQNIDVYTNAVKVKDNDELDKIVWKQLDENQGGELTKQKISFGQLLLAKVLFKEAVQEYCTGYDTESIKEALAELNEIVKDVKAAYYAAADKQAEASRPFFAFLAELIGEDVLEEVFARIDNAIATYDEYKPAVPGFDAVSFVIEQIAGGTISSREVVIAVIENLFCGEWPSIFGDQNKGKFEKIYETYTKVYVGLQVADALAGDQVEALLLDVLEKFVDALDIDIVGWDEILKSYGGNIIEKLLFGTINVGKIDITDLGIGSGSNNSNRQAPSFDEIPVAVLNIVLPSVTSYIVGDLGGVIGELIEKHFAEWAEEWAEFDKKIAENQAEIDALTKLAEVYEIYYTDLEAAKAAIAPELEDAESIYKWTNEALAAIEAGADPYTVWMENVNDWIEYLTKKVEAAAVKLATAEAAYNQVIKNHE